MKHVITLVSALIFMLATVHADDIKRNRKHKSQPIAVAPFIWGDPGEEAPAELTFVKIVKMQVPVAPFVWGNSEDVPQIIESLKIKNVSVPVAPFFLGNPDDEISINLQTLLVTALSTKYF